MSAYDPPNEIVPIFNPINYITDTGVGITQTQADYRYLQKTGGTCTGSVNFAAGILTNDGSNLSPPVGFISQSNVGVYRIGASQMGFTVGGVKQLDLSTTVGLFTNPIQLPSTTTITNCGLQIGLANTGLQYNAGVLYFGLGGTQMMRFQAAQIYSSAPHNFTSGNQTTPSVTSNSYQTTGLFWSAGNVLNITTGATQRCNFSSTAVQLNGVPLDCNSQNVKNAPQIGNEGGNLELRMNSTGGGGSLTLTGGTSLLSATSGGSSGQHLVLTINGNQYKIALLNP